MRGKDMENSGVEGVGKFGIRSSECGIGVAVCELFLPGI